MRNRVLGALVGCLLLLASHHALAVAHAALGLTGSAPVSYAQVPLDNPAEPGDASPSGPFAGGTD